MCPATSLLQGLKRTVARRSTRRSSLGWDKGNRGGDTDLMTHDTANFFERKAAEELMSEVSTAKHPPPLCTTKHVA